MFQSESYDKMIDFYQKLEKQGGTNIVKELRDILINAGDNAEYLKIITNAICDYCKKIDEAECKEQKRQKEKEDLYGSSGMLAPFCWDDD